MTDDTEIEKTLQLAKDLLERVHCKTYAPWGDRQCWCPGYCRRPLVAELKDLIAELEDRAAQDQTGRK